MRYGQVCSTVLSFGVVISWSAGPGLFAEKAPEPPGAPRWPCRLVVKPTLLGVVADGLQRSITLQRQCDALAEARAVVALKWGKTDSQSRALAQMGLRDGVVVAWIHVPPVAEAIEHVGHELEHVLEKVRGLDFEAEANRPGSGVWRAFGGFETQAAVDAGRRVAREVRESRRQ